MERKVKVKNASSARVVYSIPNLNVRRRFLPGMEMPLPFEEVQQGLYQYGVRTMFADGVLVITDEQDAADLGLKVGQGLVDKPVADIKEIKAKLEGPNGELAKFLKDASITVKENVGEQAIKMKIVDSGKVRIIEQHTGINVLNALKRESELAESTQINNEE